MNTTKYTNNQDLKHHTGICTNCLHNKYKILCKFCNKEHGIEINKYCSLCKTCSRNDYYDICGLHNEPYQVNDFLLKTNTHCDICKIYHDSSFNKYCPKCKTCCRNDYYDICGLHNEPYTKIVKTSLVEQNTLCNICKLDNTAYFIDCNSCNLNHSKYHFCQICNYCNIKYNNKHNCKIGFCKWFWSKMPSFNCFNNKIHNTYHYYDPYYRKWYN